MILFSRMSQDSAQVLLMVMRATTYDLRLKFDVSHLDVVALL